MGPAQIEGSAMIADRFTHVVISDDCGHAKPRAEIFWIACREAGIFPPEDTYVGDQYELDARAARSAGLRGVWLDRLNRSTADHEGPTVHSLADLASVLEST